MALQSSPQNLGKLEFLDIKKSLTDYLSTQSVFSGYAFQGSALSTLIDLMAYNAYYYALYSNMMISESFLDSAQRIQSLISLTKPLGYTIPSKTSSKAKIALGGVPEGTNTIPKYSVFYGKNTQGIQYKFYNLEDIPVIDSQTGYFTIHEGKNVIEIDAVNLIDIQRQRITLTDIDMDIDTLEVIVNQDGIDEIWNRVDNTGYTNTLQEKIYFVERTDTGFLIEFGLYNSVGKDITSEVRKILIRYVRSSGVFGNGINIFSSALGTVFVESGIPSAGGKEEPSLDEIKFLAPKWFAAQERAVTVNDYKALVLEAGFFGSSSEFNIYGGEEIVPARYGRVFVTSQKQLSEVNDLMDFIKQRSVLTVLPEYVTSNVLNIFVDFKFRFTDGLQRSIAQKQQIINVIKSIFNEKYGTTRAFNLIFNASDFCNDITSKLNNINITPEDFTIYVQQYVDARNSDFVFNLQTNPIKITTTGGLILSESFNSPLSEQNVVYYTTDSTIFPQEDIVLMTQDLATKISSSVGTINLDTGVVKIKAGFMENPVLFTIPFKHTNINIGLNNLCSLAIKNITVL